MSNREQVINDLQTQIEELEERLTIALEGQLEKEYEAVEPICQIIFDVPYYFCGSCKTMLNMYAVKAKYCSNCARRVKWE